MGIGLALVKRLVEKHGGMVSVQSSTAGSVFEVRLPAAPTTQEPSAQEWARSATRHTVLLIEDNPDALKSLRDLLSLEGHEVSSATDGEAGLQALLAQRPDVAIVDIGLPRLDGLQVAKRARAGGYAGRMIALTGYGQEHDVKRSLKAGFDAHLVKPLQAEQLRQGDITAFLHTDGGGNEHRGAAQALQQRLDGQGGGRRHGMAQHPEDQPQPRSEKDVLQ
jgi:CheY-like chemotaxis protein